MIPSRCQVNPEEWMARCEAAYTDLGDAGQTPWAFTGWSGCMQSANDAAVCLQDAIVLSARDDALAEKYSRSSNGILKLSEPMRP